MTPEEIVAYAEAVHRSRAVDRMPRRSHREIAAYWNGQTIADG